jgi:hypothetical protein
MSVLKVKKPKKVTHGPYRCNLAEGNLPSGGKCCFFSKIEDRVNGVMVKSVPYCVASRRKCPMIGASLAQEA